MKKDHIVYHKDGSIWAKGEMVNGACSGYWEWYRKDGTKMRSGHFIKGKQTGVWVTYNKKGNIHKVTNFSKKSGRKASYNTTATLSPYAKNLYVSVVR